MTHYLVKRGFLEQRTQPMAHIVSKTCTFKHPTSNVRATVFLVSNIGLPSYWAATRYNLTERFDRVYCEDGDFAVPAASPGGAMAVLLRYALPIIPHRMTYRNSTEAAKYVMVHPFRDPLDARIAFESVKGAAGVGEPLVDPRGRRLCEALNELPTRVHHVA